MKPRILVVDDEPIIADNLRLLLEHEGYEVETADSAGSAALRAREHEFAVALVDLVLPDGDGLHLLGLLKRRDPSLEVIIMTGHSSIPKAVEATKQGAFYFVAKPFNTDQMLALVDKALGRRRLVARVGSLLERVETSCGDPALPANLAEALREVFGEVMAVRHRLELPVSRPTAEVSDSAGLYPFLVGGLLHNAMNTIMSLRFQLARAVDTGAMSTAPDVVGSMRRIVSGVEQLEVLLQLMQQLSRSFYAQNEAAIPSSQVAQAIESFTSMSEGVRYLCKIDPALDASPLPAGVSIFIVGELLRNATKACASRAGARVSLTVAVQAGDVVSFECEDTGTGFSPETLARIRDQRLNPRTAGTPGGYGLFLMNELALRLQGTLLASNLDPSGARIQVLLSCKVES